VPADPDAGFEPCKRAIAKIAKEGRKYGASLCIVTQRPAEIDPTILSQCNTVFALRMSNDRDQQIVQSAVSDTGSGLLEFLPALGQREAIAFGDGVTLPVRIRFDELAQHNLPRSSTAKFSEKWQKSVGDEDFLQQVVDRWRSTGMSEEDDADGAASMLADAMGIKNDPQQPASPSNGAAAGRARDPGAVRRAAAGAQQRPRREGEPQERRPAMAAAAQGDARQRVAATAGGNEPARPASRRPAAATEAGAASTAASGSSSALQSLRSRIMKRDG